MNKRFIRRKRTRVYKQLAVGLGFIALALAIQLNRPACADLPAWSADSTTQQIIMSCVK